MNRHCPFCVISRDRVIFESANVLAVWDKYPVSVGHALLIPKRHVPTWFEATDTEQQELLRAIRNIKSLIEDAHSPDGYNIGINSGDAAGQTVPHLHLHVIPRYAGDVQDPRGGVRWVLPERAAYWDE